MSEYWNVMVPELIVLNFNESLEFYTNVLGFHVKFQRTNPDFAYLVYEDQVQIMIEAYHETGWNTGELLYPLGRGINLQIEVKNVDVLIGNLKIRNYPFFRELICSEYIEDDVIHRQKEFLVQDPNGYLLRFCEVQE
ncbi:VOC family protein [Clostridium sp. MSJ-4]|uniref:VOC family protein n=1 Tax=Clostridium simiarum TaxID=2841506 RepID=A0ABS6F2J8_9CLOT|nr:VOC family protein [Clostridium simiarum]MBU5592710.1 VOC family protein [Clostridium simiarum]